MNKLFSTYIIEIRNVADKGFFHLFTSQGLIVIAGFASQLFVAGILEPEDIGRIKIMQTYIGLASFIGGLGFNTSLLKLVSTNIAEKEKIKYFNLSLFVTLISFFIIYIVLYFLNQMDLISHDPVIKKLFPYYALFLLPLGIQSMHMAYYQAKKLIKKMAAIQLIIKIISVILIIIFSIIYKLEGYVIILPITGLLAVLALDIGLKPVFGKRIKLGISLNLFPVMWKIAVYVLLGGIVGTLLSTLDVYFINYLIKDRVQVGYYMFAITIVSVFQLLPASIQQVALPFFSEKSDDGKKWLVAYNKYNRLNHILILLFAVVGMIIIPPLVKLGFKGKYDDSLVFFLMLSIGWMIRSMNIIKATALMGVGKFNLNFMSSLFNLVISIPLTYFLILNFGLKGGAVAIIVSGLISYYFSLIAFNYFLQNQFSKR